MLRASAAVLRPLARRRKLWQPRRLQLRLASRSLSTAVTAAKPPPLPMSPFGAAPPKLKSAAEKKSWKRFRTPAIAAAVLLGGVGYFYKGHLEKQALERLQDRLQRRPISPQEIEDLRVGNKIECNDLLRAYHKVDAAARAAGDHGDGVLRVDGHGLSALLAEAVKPDAGQVDWTLLHRHDFDRLCAWLVETEFVDVASGGGDGGSGGGRAGTDNPDGVINAEVAKVALSLFAKDKANERVRFLLRQFSQSSRHRGLVGTGDATSATAKGSVAKSGGDDDTAVAEGEADAAVAADAAPPVEETIKRDELVRLVAALVRTFQLDYRSQTVEVKPPSRLQRVFTPSTFEIATPEQLVDKAVTAYAEVVAMDVEKARKKGIKLPVPATLGDPAAGDAAGGDKETVEAAIRARREFTLSEARGFLFSKQVCLWGQCHSGQPRARRRNDANLEKEGLNEFESATPFDAAAVAAQCGWEKVPLPEGAAAFVPAAEFQGSKPGYYFSKGPQGLGYYEDNGPVACEA